MEGGDELVKNMPPGEPVTQFQNKPVGGTIAVFQNKPPGGPIQQLQNTFKKLDTQMKTWLSKQSAPVEVALVTATNALQGGVMGGLMGTLTSDITSSMPPQPVGVNSQAMGSLKPVQALAAGPWVQARNFAVVTGVYAGIACAMKRIRGGVEDVQTSMVAAFGSGATFTLVSGVGGPDMARNAIASGLFCALFQGSLYKVGQKFFQPSTEEIYYLKTRLMLSKLGLQNYEKNFKKGLLTDSTLPLLTDSALRDANIPPGPRLLILDHIQRDPEVMWKGNQ